MVVSENLKNSKDKTLLVTGGCGFIGSSFVRIAAQKGYRIIVYDALTYAGRRENIEDWLHEDPPRGHQLWVGDICNGSKVREVLSEYQVDAIVHLAAESHVDRSIEGPAQFIQTNVVGTFALLNAALHYWQGLDPDRQDRFRFVHVSTDEVFGSLGPSGKFNETSPITPNSPYSASKASSDLLVRAWYHTFGLPALITHCSNNYGPRQFPEKLIPRMILCALRGEPLPVYGDGMNLRDWIHVDDHSRGICLALEKGRLGERYCFGGDAEKSNLDVVHQICEILDRMSPRRDGLPYRSQIEFVKDRLGHDRRYAIDDTVAQEELGFKREYHFNEGLQQTLQWYLKNLNHLKGCEWKGQA